MNAGSGSGDPQATDGTYIFGVWDGGNALRPVISQTISTLPKGRYRLSVDMQASNRSNAVRLGTQHVFAGDNKGYFSEQLSTAGEGDTYPMQTISVDFEQTADNTPVSIGVSTEGAPAETWFKIDNFRLTLFPGSDPTRVNGITTSGRRYADDGVYLVGGKMVVKHNGKKYNTAGQRME